MLGCPHGGRDVPAWGSYPYPRPFSGTDFRELPGEGQRGGTGLFVGGYFQAAGTSFLS